MHQIRRRKVRKEKKSFALSKSLRRVRLFGIIEMLYEQGTTP